MSGEQRWRAALASGVAHKLHNSVTVMDGHLARLHGATAATDPTAGALNGIRTAVDQVRDIARLLGLTAPSASAGESAFDVGFAVTDAVQLLRLAVPATFELELSVDAAEPFWAAGDGDDLRRLLVMLVGRARVALGREARLMVRVESGHGSDTIVRIRDVTGDEEDGLGWEGACARWTDAEELVERLGGSLDGDVVIRLPVVPPSPARDAVGAAARGHGEHVLIADDDRQVRGLVASMLEAGGYVPILVADGREALARVEDPTLDIRLAILDLDMPGMNGLQCTQAIRAAGSTIPVLVVSGGSALSSGLPADVGVLLKPFRMDELTQRVGEALFSYERNQDPGR